MVEITVLQRDGVRITQSDEILQRLRRIQSLEPVMSAALEPLPADLKLVTAADLRPKPPMGFLYDYIRAAGWIAELHNSTDKTARGTSAKPS